VQKFIWTSSRLKVILIAKYFAV